jgi:hypothetical protein
MEMENVYIGEGGGEGGGWKQYIFLNIQYSNLHYS